MPYITNKYNSRNKLKTAVILLSKYLCQFIDNREALHKLYVYTFKELANIIGDKTLLYGRLYGISNKIQYLAKVIINESKLNNKDAFLGYINYSIIQLIQIVPKILAMDNKCNLNNNNEFKYWLYVTTTDAIIEAMHNIKYKICGILGVYLDVLHEYKRRINISYEAEQIINSGDCFHASYYTKLIEIIDNNGKHIGYQEVMVRNSRDTLNKNIIGKLIINNIQKGGDN